MNGLKNFIAESKRILLITKKPTREEYIATVKVSALGMAAIGLLGFFITLIRQMF